MWLLHLHFILFNAPPPLLCYICHPFLSSRTFPHIFSGPKALVSDTGQSTLWEIPASSHFTCVKTLPLQPLSHSAAGSYHCPQAASAELVFSSSLTLLHVCRLCGRAIETESPRHWCSYICLSMLASAYSYICLSVIRATQEKVETPWLPELHTAFSNFAHSYVPLILQWWSMAAFSNKQLLFFKGREKDR